MRLKQTQLGIILHHETAGIGSCDKLDMLRRNIRNNFDRLRHCSGRNSRLRRNRTVIKNSRDFGRLPHIGLAHLCIVMHDFVMMYNSPVVMSVVMPDMMFDGMLRRRVAGNVLVVFTCLRKHGIACQHANQ